MNMHLALIVPCVGILLFIIHSYYKRGPKLTFLFFYFAFFIALLKEGPYKIGGFFIKNPLMPYEPALDQQTVVGNLFVVAGWIFTFYVGWYVGEKVVRRFGSWRRRIFPLVLMIGLTTASIGYMTEALGLELGWWQWNFEDPRFAEYLAGTPFIVFQTWAHFPTQYVFLPLFLIVASEFKNAYWKSIFFLIPFAHSVATGFKPGEILVYTEQTALLLLFVLAYFLRTKLDFRDLCDDRSVSLSSRYRDLIDKLPMLVFSLYILIVIGLHLIFIGNAVLTVTLLPAIFMFMFSFKRISSWVIALIAGAFLAGFGKLALPALLVVAIVLSFEISGSYAKRRGRT